MNTAVDEKLNSLLLKQIQKKFGQMDDLPPEVMELMSGISRTYDMYERERQLLERSMDISSSEMITANNKLQEQAQKLERSNQELKEFAYAVSHDLKEPLRTIASYIQLIQIRIKEQLDPEIMEFMTFSVSGVKRLQAMLDGMLKYAQVGEVQKDFAHQDLNAIAEVVLENLRENISLNKANVTLLKPLPSIRGNRIQLVQLFQNLLANSIKFRTQEEPTITINCFERKHDYLISVADNGIGVHRDERDKVFSIFKRGHSGQYEGIGMGLSICKKIVENHGGTIHISDELRDGGTCINFTFPK